MSAARTGTARALRRVRLGALALLAAGGGAAQVRPDFLAASAFGRELQQDYAGKKSRALTARFDGDAMMARVYGRDLRDRPEFAIIARQWAAQTLPGLVRAMAGHDVFPTLFVARVALLDGVRALECVLVRGDGAFHLVTLLLTESPAHGIRIEDVGFASSTLEITRAMRHLLLLLGAGLPGVLGPEEVGLAGLSRACGARAAQAIELAGKGEQEQAFREWNALPAEAKTTRLWIEHRNRMAFNGSAAAMAQLAAEARAGGGGPPAVRFSLALAAQEKPRALAALDEVILAHRGLAFLRTVKAGLLLDAGRAEEALGLARDVGTLAPATVGAHTVAFRAAAILGRPAAAAEALADWGLMAPAAAIIRAVEADASPAVAAFRATPEFGAWRRRAAAAPGAAPVSAPAK